jgi:mannuronan synthase
MRSHPYTTVKKEPTVNAPTLTAGVMPSASVVQESSTGAASQRHHPRVRLAGIVELAGRDKTRFRLYDISSGGFCFETNDHTFRRGETLRGNVIVNVDGVAITLFVGFQVRNVDERNHRAGAAFQDLGAQEAGVLKHLITSHLSGDVVNVGEVMQMIGGNGNGNVQGHSHGHGGHHAAPPPPPPPRQAPQISRAPMSTDRGGGRLRALVTTALFLGAAVVAFGYTARQANRVLFASTATAAKVAGPTYQVVMPREGTFSSLVPDDGVVKKGAPIGSFESPVLDLVRNQALGGNITPEQLQKLMKVTIKGTITSPCDCKVQTQYVANGQYVTHNQPLFELMPREFTPYLVARFRNDQLSDLAQGVNVSFRVSGESQTRSGKIVNVRAHGEGDSVDTDVMVMIQPEEALPADLLSRPAEVVAGGFGLPDIVPGLTATAKERPNP